MELSPQIKNELARWYALKEHEVQRALVEDEVRFKIVPAGRRSGKTERAKRFMARQAMRMSNAKYFLGAPTLMQAKKIWWEDMKKLLLKSIQLRSPHESDSILYLRNGTQIHIVSLDRPERIEGQAWDGGIIDEIADCKETAWTLNVKPALDTYNPSKPDYRPWCWLVGVPDGLNHYYDLFQYCFSHGLNGDSGKDNDWKAYTWHSADILPSDVIEAAKRVMSRKQFRQEYEASFETSSGRIYEDYSNLNVTQEEIAEHEQLLWCHDFNYTPLSSTVAVRRKEKTGLQRDCILFLDEIILTSAVAAQSAMEFVDKFKNHKNKNVMIYGDPSGKAGEKHGQLSNYKAIEDILRTNSWAFQRRVKSAAPAIRDRQNAVRAKIRNASDEISLFVNAAKAPYTHKGFSTVTLKEGSAFLEDETDYQHVTTAAGYMIDLEYPAAGGGSRIEIAGA